MEGLNQSFYIFFAKFTPFIIAERTFKGCLLNDVIVKAKKAVDYTRRFTPSLLFFRKIHTPYNST